MPDLSPGTIVQHDEREGRGPLEGLRAGLTAIAGDADAAYATSCDVPLLADAIEYFDASMLDDMSDDDSLKDWRIVFRSMFMRIADACDAERVQP